MIGVVQHDRIFEFRDEGNLCDALSWYGEKYGCSTIFITDTADKIKAVIHNGRFVFTPSLTDETKYLLYGANLRNVNVEDYQRNDYLPQNINWEMLCPFAYTTQPIPKQISLY